MGEQQTFELIQAQEKDILQSWLGQLREAGALQTGRIKESELVAQCAGVLRALPAALHGITFHHAAVVHDWRSLRLATNARPVTLD